MLIKPFLTQGLLIWPPACPLYQLEPVIQERWIQATRRMVHQGMPIPSSPSLSPKKIMSWGQWSGETPGCFCPEIRGQGELFLYLKRDILLFQSNKKYEQMKLWLWRLVHFGKQDASEGVIYRQKVWVYLAGLRQAERKVWVLYKKKTKIWNSNFFW